MSYKFNPLSRFGFDPVQTENNFTGPEKEAVSGINKYEVDTVAKVGTTALALQFARMANISNTLVSTDILTLSLAATAETKTGEYLLTFVTGATPPTITWPVECKDAIVISANRKYIISFVRISATRIFTFYDEEVI